MPRTGVRAACAADWLKLQSRVYFQACSFIGAEVRIILNIHLDLDATLALNQGGGCRGLGCRGFGFRGLGFRGLWFKGLGFYGSRA